MADDDLVRPVQSGILDPLIGAGFFSPNMSLEEIKRRRAIAGALASRARPFPKTIGEGMTYFGESVADAFADMQLGKAEKAYNERYDKAAGVPTVNDTLPPPVVAPRADVVPPGATPAVAAVNPLTVEPASGPANRDVIARGIMARNGAVPPGPTLPPVSPTVGAAPSTGPDGETFAEEGGPNPPTISRDIRPMQMAQVRPPAAPVQPTATPGGTLAPVIPESLPRPEAPLRSERPTPNEQRWQNILRQFPGDPRAEREFKQAHELGKAARDAEYERQKAEHDVKLRAWEARETARQNALTAEPRTRLELQKEAAAATAAQDAERVRVFQGNLSPQVAKALEESKEKAALSTGAIEAVNNAREAQKYAVSGLGADAKLLFYRGRAAIGDREAQRIVQASETYKANLVPIMQTMLKSLAGKDISTKELDFIRSVSGADLSLDKTSADRMLEIAEKVARQDVQSHHSTIETMIKGQREEALPALRKLYGVREPMAGTPLSSTTVPAEAPRIFATENEAKASGLPKGTPVIVNGRRGRID